MTDDTNRHVSASGRVVIKRVGDVETQEWNSATRGSVRWWELIGGDTMATSELVFGIAEIPVGTPRPARGHTHEPAEVYFIISGNGEVIEPDQDFIAIGSGGNYAYAAANALFNHTELGAEDIVRESLRIAASICVYTNDNISVEKL